jgi:hypothetical protein
MGYTTKFVGKLSFSDKVSVSEVREVQKWCGIDIREAEPERKHTWSYLQFEVTKELDGLQWDQGEKFYGAVDALNWLVSKVREKFPKFTLNGILDAQGEEVMDRWKLVCKDGVAVTEDCPPTGMIVRCPDCGCSFPAEENKE